MGAQEHYACVWVSKCMCVCVYGLRLIEQAGQHVKC